MKKLVIMMMSIALVSGVSAQRHGGFYRPVAPVYYRPSVGFGYGFGLGLGLGYPFYGYPYFGYPFYGMPYGYPARQSKLTQQIESIKSDYSDRIYSARNDASLNGKERRAEVKRLKQKGTRQLTICGTTITELPFKTPCNKPRLLQLKIQPQKFNNSCVNL